MNQKSWRGLGRKTLLCAALAMSALAFAGAKEDIQAAMHAGRWESADQQLQVVLAKHPDNALAHYWRAQAQLKLGHEDIAKAELDKALELDPAEKFAGDKAALAKFKKRLAAVSAAPAVQEQVQPQEPAPRVEPAVVAAPVVEAPAPRSSSGMGMGSIVLILLVVVLPVAFLLFRKQRSVLRQSDREDWQGRIREALGDLDNALRASDANQQLSPEAKLGNYDRVRQAKAELDSALSALPRTTDFGPVARIVERGQDLAADLRGEERPSDRRRKQEAANLAYERELHAREVEAQARQPMGMPGPGGAGSVLPTVAAAAVGIALGSAMSNASGRGRDDEDEMRRRDAEYDRMAAGSGSSGGSSDFDVDLGGSGDTSSDWSSSSDSDTSGGGDNSFD